MTISPKQGQQGKSYVITIKSTNCDAVNFKTGKYKVLQEENSGIKITGDDNTVDGGCTYTAQLTVDTSAPFGDVFLKLKPDSGMTLTVPFSVAAVAPGPVPPGIEPQVDILWSVVPKQVVSDNFGKRVGNNFYCLEIVIGNSSGYDIQLASVGFKVGPIGPYAKVAADTRQKLAALTLENNKLAIADIVKEALAAREAIQKCSGKDCNPEKMAKDLEDRVKEITDRAFVGQNAGVAAAKAQAEKLSEASQQAYAQKIPVSSYRMSRGSVEHGQFWDKRNLLLNFVKAAGPLLTGFTPFFHVLNRRNNFSQGINIFSDPFEKGIELVFPDETVRQLQRLDEQMLRDGLTILNNQQVRTRAFIPKDLLGLEGKLKDDWATVTQALGTLILVGDKIQYINRIQVTATAAPEVKPPPTINRIDKVFLIGKGDDDNKITISGRNMDDLEVRSNDDKVKPKLKKISSTAAELTVSLVGGVKEGDYRLVFDGASGSVIRTIRVDYPVATINPAKTTIETATFSPTRDRTYKFHVEGTNLFNPDVTIFPGGPVIGEKKVSADGTALDVDIVVPAKTSSGDYELSLTTTTQAKTDSDKPVKQKFTIAQQPDPSGVLTYETPGNSPPTAGKDKQVVITINGDNLDGATIETPTGFTADADGKNKDQKKLTTKITIADGTAGQTAPFIFVVHNNHGTVNVNFKLNPASPAPTPATSPTPVPPPLAAFGGAVGRCDGVIDLAR